MNKEIVDKYLRGECNEQEAVYVRQYFKKHPSEADTYFTFEEWHALMTNNKEVSADLQDEMFTIIKSSIARKRIFTTMLKAGSAAAVFLFFALLYFYNDNNLNKNIQQKNIAQSGIQEEVRINQTGIMQRITLPDGSLVLLYPKSEITYKEDYNIEKRDIYLKGKATFDVAKNAAKPFIVFCGEISARALGTRFEVNGFAKNTAVILFEGKVLVKNIENEKIHAYLTPGDKIVFNAASKAFETVLKQNSTTVAGTNNMEAAALAETVAVKAAKKEDLKVTEDILPKRSASAYLKFHNQNLKSVINQLSELYNVEINYPTEISSSINLYLSVDTSQPIEKILKNIATVNGMEIIKLDSNKYFFKK